MVSGAVKWMPNCGGFLLSGVGGTDLERRPRRAEVLDAHSLSLQASRWNFRCSQVYIARLSRPYPWISRDNT